MVFVIRPAKDNFQVGPTSNEAQAVAEVNKKEKRLVLGGTQNARVPTRNR